MQPDGEYGAIIDRLGAMADREQKSKGGYIKLGEFAVFALRGFGVHKTVIGEATHGCELGRRLRRQARSERDKLRQGGDSVPYSESDGARRDRR